MNNCIFCKIGAKTIPAKIQFEDGSIIAFDDINPKAPVHILIVPKEHIESVKDIDDQNVDIIGKMVLAAKKIAKEKGLEGYKFVFNVGKEGGQLVDHLHLHLLGGQNIKEMI